MARVRGGLTVLAVLLASTTASAAEQAAPRPVTTVKEAVYALGPATIECTIAAAREQRVPANILLAIASQEDGKNGQAVTNKNGSMDLGHFQINSVHFKPGGIFATWPQITIGDVAWRGCYNAQLAGWLLHRALTLSTEKDYWVRVANYHCAYSVWPAENARYRQAIMTWSKKWADWLTRRYPQRAAVAQR